MKNRSIAILLVVFFSINLLTAYIATMTIPYLGFYSYPEMMTWWNSPQFINRFASFDGLHYVKIVQNGYQGNSTAFLPIYPILIGLFTSIFSLNPIISGILVSMVTFTLAIFVLQRYLALIAVEKRASFWTILFLLAFPTSFYFQSVYTESVFFLLLVSTLYFSQIKKYRLAILFGFLTGLSRITGFFLAIPLFMSLLGSGDFKNKTYLAGIVNFISNLDFKKILLILAPPLGLATYMVYLWYLTGDPMRLAHSQVDFGQNRTSAIIFPPQVIYRYLRIFLTAKIDFVYFISVLEFVTMIGASIILYLDARNIYFKKYKYLPIRAGLNIFAWLSLLLPSLTGTLLSMPRFILSLLSIFLFLGNIKSKYLKFSIFIFFTILHFILLALFIQGYFVS